MFHVEGTDGDGPVLILPAHESCTSTAPGGSYMPVGQGSGVPHLGAVGHGAGVPHLGAVGHGTGVPHLGAVGHGAGVPRLGAVGHGTGVPHLMSLKNRGLYD